MKISTFVRYESYIWGRMKILLLGECSNLHWTLAEGLRQLGHVVTVASDGSRWMGNSRNIDLTRISYGIVDTLRYIRLVYKNLDKFKGYDIVQIKNPLFVDMRAEQNLWLYKYLKRNNSKVFMGAFGTDYYWIKACLDQHTFRYSDYFVGNNPTNIPMAESLAQEWKRKEKIYLNKYIADTCNGIVACLYEYYAAYLPYYSDKLTYIPIPVNTDNLIYRQKEAIGKLQFFIGVQSDRDQLKGTDVLLKCISRVSEQYPNSIEINKAENIPNTEYIKQMSRADILLDQIYSYTPGMNALTAMAQGLVAVSGAEPEMYSLLGDTQLQPLINVLPNEADIYQKLESLILAQEKLPELSKDSRLFVEKYHDSTIVAEQYLDFWSK